MSKYFHVIVNKLVTYKLILRSKIDQFYTQIMLKHIVYLKRTEVYVSSDHQAITTRVYTRYTQLFRALYDFLPK